MEEAAYCMEQSNGRCKMYCGEKNQMYSAMSGGTGTNVQCRRTKREESLACHLAVRNQLLKNGYREGSMLLMVDNNMSVVYLDLGKTGRSDPISDRGAGAYEGKWTCRFGSCRAYLESGTRLPCTWR